MLDPAYSLVVMWFILQNLNDARTQLKQAAPAEEGALLDTFCSMHEARERQTSVINLLHTLAQEYPEAQSAIAQALVRLVICASIQSLLRL